MFGKLSPAGIERLLQRQLVGRLGCANDGEAYVVPISYVYDVDAIICHSHEGKKLRMMRRNPSVCFQLDELKDMANWESVLVTGVFEEICDAAGRERALKLLLRRYLPPVSSATTHLGAHWPFEPECFSEVGGIVFRIRIRDRSGRFESGVESPHFPV
ncbi:MAG: pyridoxamine 5'-phosphate oxidase family protein [Chitinophagaceae bacterium]|nr:MAG: pyridoxamine 5'-phosphate oxidase family protein [Chitinophagaceae bacterium]